MSTCVLPRRYAAAIFWRRIAISVFLLVALMLCSP
jgi:hypothetical protein